MNFASEGALADSSSWRVRRFRHKGRDSAEWMRSPRSPSDRRMGRRLFHGSGSGLDQIHGLIDGHFAVSLEGRIDINGAVFRVEFLRRHVQMAARHIIGSEAQTDAVGTVLAFVGEVVPSAAGSRLRT